MDLFGAFHPQGTEQSYGIATELQRFLGLSEDTGPEKSKICSDIG
jgi:hypothetical protein